MLKNIKKWIRINLFSFVGKMLCKALVKKARAWNRAGLITNEELENYMLIAEDANQQILFAKIEAEQKN